MSSGKNLSPQQKIILQHLVNGRTIKEVSSEIGIAIATVRKHINKAKAKMGGLTHDHTIALVIARGEVIVHLDCEGETDS